MSRALASRSLRCILVLVGAAVACDPVRSEALDSVPAQTTNVPNGPLHHPGAACLLCHNGDFVVAGTVFEVPETLLGADHTTVALTDSDGDVYDATTNSAGNFYITPDQWSPTFPLVHISVTSAAGVVAIMQSQIGRDGACATCHADPAGPASPGHVSLAQSDGGALP